MLDRTALGLLRIRHALAHVPDRLLLRFRAGDGCILDQAGLIALLEQRRHHPLGRLGRIRGGDIDQHIPGMRRLQRISHAGDMARREFDAEARHQLETGQRRAAQARGILEQGQRIVDRLQTGEGDLMAERLRKEF